MNTETGEIKHFTEHQIKKMAKAERKKWIPLIRISPAALRELNAMPPGGRIDWFKANREDLMKEMVNDGKHSKRRVLAVVGRGMTRRQLRQAGIKLRPRQARILAERSGVA